MFWKQSFRIFFTKLIEIFSWKAIIGIDRANVKSQPILLWIKAVFGPLGLFDDFGVVSMFLINFWMDGNKNETIKRLLYWPKVIGYGLLTALYIWSPIDLIPEKFLGPIGYVDDLFAFYYYIQKVCREADLF